MEKLLPLINAIQDIFVQTNLSNSIQLPQLVVVGAQSTGKSSVLEAIVGKDFLPRGSGIVTRRPIILQLHHTAEDFVEYAEFAHKKGQKFYDYNQVRKEIEFETEQLAGQNKGISSSPIIVKIYSPNVVDLNLVDLPGITKIPVGDQPPDIESKIREMVMTYIKNPNTIILAISAANTDLANSDALKLAREVDPEGVRTLGVVTKLDTLDEDTDALDTLQGKLYPLKLGYVGVVCRNQKDLNAKKTVKESLEAEREFFQKHKAYKLYAERMGVPYLTNTLKTIFIKHIKKSLPQIKNKIDELVHVKQIELMQYGEPEFDENNKDAKGLMLLSLISRFSSAYSNYLKGNYTKSDSLELFGGARINYIINEGYIKTVTDLDPFDMLTDDDIRTATKNSDGLEDPLFVSEKVFDILIRQQISRLLAPSLQLAQQIYEELRKIVFEINFPELARFEALSVKLQEVMQNLLFQSLKPTEEMIRNLIQIELGFINRNHPNFLDGADAILEILKGAQDENKNPDLSKLEKKPEVATTKELKKPTKEEVKKDDSIMSRAKDLFSFKSASTQKPDTNEIDNKLASLSFTSASGTNGIKEKARAFEDPTYFNVINNTKFPNTVLPEVPSNLKVTENPSKKDIIQVKLIKKLILSYLNVVKRNINDSVPKTIITFLINKTRDTCERELILKIYKEEKFEALLTENSVISKLRGESKKQLSVLQQCANVLSDIDSKLGTANISA